MNTLLIPLPLFLSLLAVFLSSNRQRGQTHSLDKIEKGSHHSPSFRRERDVISVLKLNYFTLMCCYPCLLLVRFPYMEISYPQYHSFSLSSNGFYAYWLTLIFASYLVMYSVFINNFFVEYQVINYIAVSLMLH